MTSSVSDPNRYVRENRETLVRIIKHGDDEFVRALALSALVRYGDEPQLNDVEYEIEQAREQFGVSA